LENISCLALAFAKPDAAFYQVVVTCREVSGVRLDDPVRLGWMLSASRSSPSDDRKSSRQKVAPINLGCVPRQAEPCWEIERAVTLSRSQRWHSRRVFKLNLRKPARTLIKFLKWTLTFGSRSGRATKPCADSPAVFRMGLFKETR